MIKIRRALVRMIHRMVDHILECAEMIKPQVDR